MRWAALLLAVGCDDHLFLPEGGAPLDGACGVEAVITDSCALGGCHDPGASSGLDLTADPLAALVGVESPAHPGAIYVVAGDPEGSLLWRKLSGTQSPDEGVRMPVGPPLATDTLDLVRAWIADGATPCGVSP